MVNTAIQVTKNGITVNYFFSPKHRGNATDDISVWTISFDSELSCFSTTFEEGWHNKNNGWGCVAVGGSLTVLGHNLRNPELIIAKFVVDQNQWHGYPADIRNKPKDKPLPDILSKWLNKGYITKAVLARIKQGQI